MDRAVAPAPLEVPAEVARSFEVRPGADVLAQPLELRLAEGRDLWAALERPAVRAFVRDAKLTIGAVLFRRLPLAGAADFQRLIDRLSAGRRAAYREPQSPRTRLVDNVFTSTEYPASQTIHPHNENVHCLGWPKTIAFWCREPARTGGATTIASTRRVQERIAPALLEAFAARGVRYARAFGYGFGFGLATVFGTDERDAIDRYCAENRIERAWGEGGKLRTWYDRPAFVVHPDTGERLWCNNVVHLHPASLEPRLYRALRALANDEQMPFRVSFGGGEPIAPEALDALRAAYAQATHRFDWKCGDVLVLDNMLFAHGREPYAGARRVLVSMAEPVVRTAPGASRDAACVADDG